MSKEVQEKTTEAMRLADVIKLNWRVLTRAEKEKIEALEYGLTIHLQELVEESKIKEIDLKLGSMRKVLQILKKQDGK